MYFFAKHSSRQLLYIIAWNPALSSTILDFKDRSLMSLKHSLQESIGRSLRTVKCFIVLFESRLPYMVNSLEISDELSVRFVVKPADSPSAFTVTVDDTDINLARMKDLGGLYSGVCSGIISLDKSFKLSIPADNSLEELLMIVKYSLV